MADIRCFNHWTVVKLIKQTNKEIKCSIRRTSLFYLTRRMSSAHVLHFPFPTPPPPLDQGGGRAHYLPPPPRSATLFSYCSFSSLQYYKKLAFCGMKELSWAVEKKLTRQSGLNGAKESTTPWVARQLWLFASQGTNIIPAGLSRGEWHNSSSVLPTFVWDFPATLFVPIRSYWSLQVQGGILACV